MGISALALEGAQRISSDDVTAGLVLPFAAVRLLGYSGAVCTTLMVFMAVTRILVMRQNTINTSCTAVPYRARRASRKVWALGARLLSSMASVANNII